MEPATYLAYLATVALFFAHPPGPSQLLFMANALRHGVRGAMPTLAGDLFANSIQIGIAGFGLVGIVAMSATFFTAVKWLGVAYLAWMGLRALFARPSADGAVRRRSGALFNQGFVTSAANPYAVVFFAALFPQFIDADAALMPQIAILGTTYLVIDGCLLVVLGLATQRIFRLLGGRAHLLANRISGGLMIAAAVLLSFRELAPAPSGR